MTEAIETILAEAVDHHRAGRLAVAETLYRRVLDADANDINALHLLGLIVRHSGRLEECLGLIGRALQLNPAFLDARINLGNILQDAGRPAAAAAEWRRLAVLEPGLAMAWHGVGAALDRQGSAAFPQAIAALGRALRLDPGSAAAHHDLGLVLRHAERLEESIGRQRDAIAAGPEFLPAHMNLGMALLEQGNLSEAAARLRRAVALGPASVECWYNLGNIHHCAGDPAAALVAYGRAARMGFGLACGRLAHVLTDLGRLDEATHLLLDGLAQPGTDVSEAVERLTHLFIRQGRRAEARALLSRLMEMPLAGALHQGDCLTALAALDLAEEAPQAAAARLANVRGDAGWFFTIKSLAALQSSLAERGLRLRRPAANPPGARPRVTSSTLAGRGRFAHNALEYVLLRLYAEKFGYVLETPDWVGGAFFDLNDPPQSEPLPPLLFSRRLLNGWVTGSSERPPMADRDILSPLFLFDHKEAYRERVQSWLRPRTVWSPWLAPAVERLRGLGSTIVAIHIRRGDFVTCGYPITETDWYLDWLRELWPRLDRPVLYLASDDLAAVQGAFAEFRPVVRADVAPPWPGLEYLQDFHVLTQADVVGISAASGFSQLAARLNRRAGLFAEPDVAGRRIRPFQPWVP